MADHSAEADFPSAAGTSGPLLPNVPRPADFAARCLAVGIGTEGGWAIDELSSASWFAHLHRTATKSRCSIQQAGRGRNGLRLLLKAFPTPQIASIALRKAPTSAEISLAYKLGCLLRDEYGAFVIITAVLTDTDMLEGLGQACDCFVEGDGSLIHHHYPIRTVSEPVGGRPVCYDLYDACSMWAGQVGEYGVFRPGADALHVEGSAAVTLSEVNDFATGYGLRLHKSDNLKLFNVVGNASLPQATPISFRRHSLVCQDRASERAQKRVKR